MKQFLSAALLCAAVAILGCDSGPTAPKETLEFSTPNAQTVWYENSKADASWTAGALQGQGFVVFGCGTGPDLLGFARTQQGYEPVPSLADGTYHWIRVVDNLAGGDPCRLVLLDQSKKTVLFSLWFTVIPSR